MLSAMNGAVYLLSANVGSCNVNSKYTIYVVWETQTKKLRQKNKEQENKKETTSWWIVSIEYADDRYEISYYHDTNIKRIESID